MGARFGVNYLENRCRGLDEHARAAFGSHLDGCAECRAKVGEFEPVTESMARSAPKGTAVAEPRPSADLAERTLALVGQAHRADPSRRRRAWRAGLAAVAVGPLALAPRFVGPPVEPVAFSGVARGVEAEANSVTRVWGTETRLAVSGLEDGAPASSGAFYGTGDRPVEVYLSTALEREEATGMRVRSANGELMLAANFPEEPRSL